jgi:hypothetical protein
MDSFASHTDLFAAATLAAVVGVPKREDAVNPGAPIGTPTLAGRRLR